MSKPFAWSYSQLKNFETCPKRYYHYNVAKDVVEPQSAALTEGNDLHKAFENRIKHKQELPLGMGQYENMLARIVGLPGVVYAEQKLAMNANFAPTTWFGKDVWLRTILDCTYINEAGVTAATFDWKTGKPAQDLTQMQLAAATLFCHQPKLERVKVSLVFVNHNKTEPGEFVREDLPEIWSEILPRVKQVESARAAQEYPPKPSGLCKRYCAVVSCPYHGKGLATRRS
jgi:hypothetical protein